MVSLANAAVFSRAKVPVRIPQFSIPAAIALTCAVVVIYSLGLRNFEDNGFRLASQNAWRFGCFVFFAAIVAGPAGRLVPPLRRLEELSCSLFSGFCASFAIYLLLVLLPSHFRFAGVENGPGAGLFVMFSSFVTLVMTLALTHRMTELAGGAVRRALLGVSAAYFWFCYTLMGLAYISHPHRPDGFYNWSLGLMIAALLLRFADSCRGRYRPVTAT